MRVSRQPTQPKLHPVCGARYRDVLPQLPGEDKKTLETSVRYVAENDLKTCMSRRQDILLIRVSDFACV